MSGGEALLPSKVLRVLRGHQIRSATRDGASKLHPPVSRAMSSNETRHCLACMLFAAAFVPEWLYLEFFVPTSMQACTVQACSRLTSRAWEALGELHRVSQGPKGLFRVMAVHIRSYGVEDTVLPM